MRWMWIDRILTYEPGHRLVAIKNVSMAEEHLHDHFAADADGPALPVMPASLIIEGMAQTAGILVGAEQRFAEKVILAKVSKVALERDVVPGQTLRYEARLERMDAGEDRGDRPAVQPPRPEPRWNRVSRGELRVLG
jgi:3-hydroxyacyl-[acyl-carrier-protein] dehydratase